MDLIPGEGEVEGLPRSVSAGGLGLGLAIARVLAKLDGVTIGASSEGAGKDTTFNMELPILPRKAGPVAIDKV